MNSTADKFVKGIYSEYVGKRSQVLAEIEVYLNSPVGVGEHSKISVEINFETNNLSDQQTEKLIAVAKGCPVAQSLSKDLIQEVIYNF